jgi:hypothetical protein
MRVLVAGSAGQLGRALQASAPAGVTLIAPPEAEFDITDPDSVEAAVAAAAPTLVINAAAYTAVDRAESEARAAQSVNVNAVGLLASAARRAGAGFVQVSTDFIFDGTAHRPYPVDALPGPLGVYGRTKLEGEQAALQARLADPAFYQGPPEAVREVQQRLAGVDAEIDIALARFGRIIGLRDGALAFDLPAHEVTRELLARLYAQHEHELDAGAAWSPAATALPAPAPLPAMHCR